MTENSNSQQTNSDEGNSNSGLFLIGVFVVIVGLTVYDMYFKEEEIYTPSEQEIKNRPEMLVIEYNLESDDTVKSESKTFFGVANGQAAFKFLYHKGIDPVYKSIPSKIGVSKFRKGDVRYALTQKFHTNLAWHKEIKLEEKPEARTVRLIVDNATSEEIVLEIGSEKFPAIKPGSHGIAKVPQRQEFKFRVKSNNTKGTEIQFPIFLTKVDKGFTGYGIPFYIYNHQTANTYYFTPVTYKVKGIFD